MNNGVSLKLEGFSNQQHLMIVLLGAVCLVLAGYAVWRMVQGRLRYGLICVSAALGPPVLLAALLVDAAVQHGRGNSRAAGRSLLGAGALIAGLALAAALIGGASNRAAAFWMALVGLQVASAVGMFYGAVYAYLGTGRLAALMCLRCAAILALLLVLFKPVVSISADADENKARLPILVDRSGSMGTTDQAGVPDRYVQVIQMLKTQRERLGRHFRPSWYHFAQGLQRSDGLESLAKLTPSGKGTDGTNLAAAIRGATADHNRSELPGVLLLTDGIHNASEPAGDAAVEAGVPVYTVGVGSPNETLAGRRNLRLLDADAPLEVVKNNVTTVTVRVKMTGLASVPAEVRLLAGDSDQPVDTQPLRTDKNVATVTAKLKWTPRDAPGEAGEAGDADVRKLRIVIPLNPAEVVKDDNQGELHVLVIEPRIRVLYVEGTIRPEYKYLRRLLDSDPNVEFMALVRISGNKFWGQGSISGRKFTALPRTAEDFGLVDVLILGDLDRTFFSGAQISRVRRFVNDGGGLVMLGGYNSFGPGGYGGTDIEAALPVVTGTRTQAQETTPFVPRLTAAGKAHPILDGLDGFFYGPGGQRPDAGLPKLPDLRGCVTVVRGKPAAQVLAVHPTRRNAVGSLIVMAVQQFGAGRSAAFTPDTTWRWYLPLQGMSAESPYRRFWSQTIRWLARAETKSRLSAPAAVLRVSASHIDFGKSVRILARVQDQKGQATNTASASCTIIPDKTGVQAEALELALRGAGVFEGVYRPPADGKYTIKLTAVDSAAQTLGTDELKLSVAPRSSETARLARDREDRLLRNIAERSEGRFADISALPEMVDLIVRHQKARTGQAPEGDDYALYDFTTLFIAFVVLLTAEWLLRRNWQLH